MPRRCYCLLGALLLLPTGCSSSSLLSNREPQRTPEIDRPSVETGDAPPIGSRESAGTPRGTGAASRPGRGDATAAERGSSSKRVAEALAAAVRYEQQGDDARAQAEYRRILQIDPQHAFARYQLAIAADNAGEFAEAERHYQALLARTPDNPDLLASLGWSYLLQERYDESERTLRDALAADPQHKTALYNLGWLYGTKGRYDEAQSLFRAAGNEADAEQALARLFPQGRPAGPTPGGNEDSRRAGPVQQAAAVIDVSDSPGPPQTAAAGKKAVQSAEFSQAHDDDESLEQMFARLDNRRATSGGERNSAQAAGPRRVGDVAAPSSTGGELLQVDSEPEATVRSGAPQIRPGAGRTPPRNAQSAAAAFERDDAGFAGVRARAPASPAGSLPEWPRRHLPGGPSRSGGQPGANTAARWGLFVGPGGLLFPPVDPPVTIPRGTE